MAAKKTPALPKELDAWKLSGLRSKLPEAERANAAAELWKKSDGVCHLCDEPLTLAKGGIDVDHLTAFWQDEGGDHRLSNLFLAHAECNRSRGNLPFDLARPIIRFRRWNRAIGDVTYEQVAEKYVSDTTDVKVHRDGSQITLSVDAWSDTATVYVDPPTATEYFFLDVPIRAVKNDNKTQPRFIEDDHVRALAIDFWERPVHEPSNCRLVPTGGKTAQLLQFDGQHKATAQLLLGRAFLPMKVYIDPNVDMLQKLVLKIQQGIKKRPLSRSATLRKLKQIVRQQMDEYSEPDGKPRTEKGFIDSKPKQHRTEAKAEFLQSLYELVLFEGNHEFQKFVSEGRADSYPMTDKAMVDALIAPLVCQQLLDEDLDSRYVSRDHEREGISFVLQLLVELMLDGKWDPSSPEDLHHRRARNMFYGGVAKYWMKHLLKPTMRIVLDRPADTIFLSPLEPEDKKKLRKVADKLCSNPIWSTSDADALAAFRSNTQARIKTVLDDNRLDDGKFLVDCLT